MLEVLKGFEKVDVGKLGPAAHFKNDLGLDSLDTVEVVMAVEEEFAIEIPDAEAEKIQSCEGALQLNAEFATDWCVDDRGHQVCRSPSTGQVDTFSVCDE